MLADTLYDKEAFGFLMTGSRAGAQPARLEKGGDAKFAIEKEKPAHDTCCSSHASQGDFPDLNAVSAQDLILVTGVTGFLGGALVAELLGEESHFSGRLLLMVRAATHVEGMERVKKSLARFEVPASALDQLKQENIICGDLANVEAIADDPRLDAVTYVINCAGITSFGKDPNVWRVNVEGTLEFARRLKRAPGLKRFTHISTAMICGDKPPSVVQEDVSLSINGEHLVPYTESKAEAERRLMKEMAGLPFVVVRPTIIAGHTKLGCRPSGSIFWAFRMCHALRMTTSPLDGKIDVVPVDYAARAVLHLAMARKLKHHTYHVGSGPSYSSNFAEIDAAFVKMEGRGSAADFRSGTIEEALAKKDSYQSIFGKCNRRFMQVAVRLYGSFASLNATFDNSRLMEEGAPPPPKFADYLSVCLETCREVSIYAQAMIDFV